LQHIFYAYERRSLLLVFQAMDAAGKDSTIRAVLSGVNPAGCQVYSFKQPSHEELQHDFLWRTTVRQPERGRIGVFNRSYYEEVLIARVHPEILAAQQLPGRPDLEQVWEQRYVSIRDHEKHLARNGTVILKFWLNVSKEEQRRRFLAALAKCRGIALDRLFVHADNSAGLETMPGASPFNAVRIGLLQFGVLPHPRSLLAQVRTEPVFSFHTRVGLVKALPRGTTISYGRTHTLARDSVVAVLCAGYGDGFPRSASNRASVLIHGRSCAVLGRVTMDQTVVDVTGVPGVACGDEAVLVGRQGSAEITLAEFSRWADTIPWETLCSVTKRVPRVYKTSLGV